MDSIDPPSDPSSSPPDIVEISMPESSTSKRTTMGPGAVHSSPSSSSSSSSSSSGGFKRVQDLNKNNTASPVASPRFVKKKLTHTQMILISFLWFSRSAFQAAVTVFLLPNQIKAMVGDEYKGTAIGIADLSSAVVSVWATPLFGTLSDNFAKYPPPALTPPCYHSIHPWIEYIYIEWGNRLPFIALGIFLGIFPAVAMGFCTGGPLALIPFSISFMLVGFFDAMAMGPFSALIPDLVSQTQFGAASGWMGLMMMLGILVGGGAVGPLFHLLAFEWIYVILGLVLLSGGLVTILVISYSVHPEPYILPKENDAVQNNPSARSLLWAIFISFLDPFKFHNFRWVFIIRFLMTLGFFVMCSFAHYFMLEIKPWRFLGMVEFTNADQATGFFITGALMGALVAAATSGILSDIYGRKPLLFASGVVQAIVPISFVFFMNFSFAVVMGVVFGLGYGAYVSVDWALGSDSLPSSKNRGKDLGVWHTAMALPVVVGPMIAGMALDALQPVGKRYDIDNLGFKTLFGFVFVIFCVGTTFIYKIRVMTPEDDDDEEMGEEERQDEEQGGERERKEEEEEEQKEETDLEP